MMIKRYVVKDMPEAIVMIRKDLGKDAVILSTKPVNVRKWMGLWRMKRIEDVAAAGEDIPLSTFHGSRSNDRTAKPSGQSPTPVESDRREQQVGPDESSPELGASNEAATADTVGLHPESRYVEPRPSEQRADWDSMQRDVLELKQMMQTILAKSPPGHILEPQTPWVKNLMDQGVSEERARQWLESVHPPVQTGAELRAQPSFEGSGRPSNPGSPEEDNGLRSSLHARLVEELGELALPSPLSANTRFALFVGPTGVGKTTTIAKLAALHVLGGRRKVGLLTTDTYRIAAVEQLRTYANILGIPVEVVDSPQSFPDAVDKLGHCDLVFIDTAGRNFVVDEHLQEMERLMEHLTVDEVFLVLSVTAKSQDLHRVVAQFSKLRVDKLLFTKLDETATYGSIVELVLDMQKPVSYFTTGQNVPNDIEVASLDKVFDRLFAKEGSR